MSNLKEFVELTLLLFPQDTLEEMYDIYRKSFAKGNELGILYEKDNRFVGCMHLAIRSDYVNGTDTSPVLFVEAIYVLPEYRGQNIGREFIEYATDYAKQKGIKQLASDCFMDNIMSENFHKACGFIEKERVICFVKDIE